jgi:ATP-dependent DNA helicase RecQ
MSPLPQKTRTLSSVLETQGIRHLLPPQELVIRRLLESPRLDQAVIFPTGFGKSLCFQVPAALFSHPTLVVYPLRALLADQKRRFQAAGLAVEILQGGQTRRERQGVFLRLAQRRVDLVLTNPEALAVEKSLKRLELLSWSHLVVDEAHCVATWGADFRPAYRNLAAVFARLKAPRVSAFTATANAQVEAAWKEQLFAGREFQTLRLDPDRPNIYFSRRGYLSLRRVLTELAETEAKPMAIFSRSREGVRTWARHLAESATWPVRFYHAGLTASEKHALENWFRTCPNGILVTTNAFGMGVDHPGIRTVVHLAPPASTADYLQEAGRAGRDGQPAKALLLVKDLNPVLHPQNEPSCLRHELFDAFGTIQDCSGCDACLGRSFPGDRGDAVSFLRSGHRRWTQAETRERLFAHWRDWPGWEREEAWNALSAFGWIEFPRHGFFKGLLKLRE